MRHSSFTSENQGQPVSNHKLYVHTQCGQTIYDILFRFLRSRDLTKVKPALNDLSVKQEKVFEIKCGSWKFSPDFGGF